MSILNKYKHWGYKIMALEDEYLDFVLSKDDTPSIWLNGNLNERCLASYIDLGDLECREPSGVCSYWKYGWDSAKTENVVLKDIGFTGIDNGFIYYGSCDRITNKQFLDIITNSKFETQSGDTRLHLYSVTANTALHSFEYEKQDEYYAFKGGFLQGFYKLHGFDYQVLPTHIDNSWHIEITLRPRSDYKVDSKALNAFYPDNEGLFFYMGTRAEDKFCQMYNCDLSKYNDRAEQKRREYCEYFEDGYFAEVKPENEEKKEKKPKPIDTKFYNIFKGNLLYYYVNALSYRNATICDCNCECGSGSVVPPKEDEKEECDKYYLSEADYIEKDIKIDENGLVDSEGRSLSETGYYKIETDNKFLTFNRTKYGFTTSNWDDDTLVVLEGSKSEERNANLYLLMNRTRSGYTTDTIDEWFNRKENRKVSDPTNYHTGDILALLRKTESGYTYMTVDEYYSKKNECDLMKNIKGNSFALKYNADGSISFKYLVKDCDAEEGYSVLTGGTYPGMVSDNEWAVIDVRFNIVNSLGLDKCGLPAVERKMKIYIYVNGYLKYVSKELPEFNFRELDTSPEKQEGVPFNISLGGGTQGLCDSVWVDYCNSFEKILPIEKNFAGTFIGDIKSFKFYTCPMEYMEVKNNYLYEIKRVKKVFI